MSSTAIHVTHATVERWVTVDGKRQLVSAPCRVEVIVDLEKIAQEYGHKVIFNKSGRARYMKGAVILRDAGKEK